MLFLCHIYSERETTLPSNFENQEFLTQQKVNLRFVSILLFGFILTLKGTMELVLPLRLLIGKLIYHNHC